MSEQVTVTSVTSVSLEDIELEMNRLDYFYTVGAGMTYRNGSNQQGKIQRMVNGYLDLNPNDSDKITELSHNVCPNSYFIGHGTWAIHWKYGK